MAVRRFTFLYAGLSGDDDVILHEPNTAILLQAILHGLKFNGVFVQSSFKYAQSKLF